MSLKSRRKIVALAAMALLVVPFAVAPVVAQDADDTTAGKTRAWETRLDTLLDRVEAACKDLDGQLADEGADFPTRLRGLHARVLRVEKELDLRLKRFWLYEGDAEARRLSSWTQMAAQLSSRVKRARRAKSKRAVEEANESVRERDESGTTGSRSCGNGARRAGASGTSTRGEPVTEQREPELVHGKLGPRQTISVIHVPLAKDLQIEFTVVMKKPATQGGATGAPAITTKGNGGANFANSKGEPEPDVRIVVVSNGEGLAYPQGGKILFRTGEEGTPQERKVEITYKEMANLTSMLGGSSKLQMLGAKVDGQALKAVVSRADISVTVVEGEVESTPVAISGKGLDLLRQLLSVFEDSAGSCPCDSEAPSGSTTTSGGPSNSTQTGAQQRQAQRQRDSVSGEVTGPAQSCGAGR